MATDSVTVSPTYNGDTVPLTAGMIVRLKPGANNTVVRAQASSSAGVQGVNGVVVSGSSAPGTICTVSCVGRQTVQMASGLTLVVGQTVYVSASVAGVGTNVVPGTVSAIGSIVDTSAYARSGTVEVDVIASGNSGGGGGGVASLAVTAPGLTPTAPTTGAVVIAGGGIAVADSVNTTGTALTAISAANFPIGNTLAFVKTTGRYYILQVSALPVDNINIATAANLPGAQWIGLYQLGNPLAAAQTTWIVDPVSGNDEANGLTNGTALKTATELSRRTWGARPSVAVSVTFLDDVPTVDAPFFDWLPAGSAGQIIFNGTATVLYAGTIATVTAQSAGPTTTTNQISDTGIPVSYTASGLLATGILFLRTNGQQAVFYGAVDLGTKTLLISETTALNLTAIRALAPGDSYEALQLTKVGSFQFAQATNAIIYRQLNVVAGATAIGAVPPIQYQNCWFTGAVSTTQVGSLFQACAFGTNITINGGSSAYDVAINRCTFRGVAITQNTGVLGISGGTWEASSLTLLSATANIANALTHVNASGACITAGFASRLNIQTGGSICGSGNTSKLLVAAGASQISYSASPVVAGSSSDASPITVGGTSYAVSALPVPIGAGGDGVYQSDVAGAFQPQAISVAAGSVAVTINNAPAGSPSAPLRYAQFNDGAGGVFTLPSLT